MGGKGQRKGRKLVINPDRKVWIGGLPVIQDREKRKEASKKLQEHFKNNGSDCKFAEISHKGTGVAQFQTEEAATSAIDTLSGTKFMGKALVVDTWAKE